MTNVQKNVGELATFTAVVRNKDQVVLAGVPVVFTSDSEPLTVLDDLDVTVVGSTAETVTVTATATGANGDVSGAAAVDFVDNVPASVEVTVA